MIRMDAHWIDTAIGAEIRAARARVGWTRKRLCAEIGIGPAALQRYESGERSIPADVLFEAVHALRIDLADIDRAVTRASMDLFGVPWPAPSQADVSDNVVELPTAARRIDDHPKPE